MGINLAGTTQRFFNGVPSGSARDGVIGFDTAVSPWTMYVYRNGIWNLVISGGAAPSPANPTATAGPMAINGVAVTFMRSDAAPAVQVGSASQLGLLQVD